MRIIPFSCKVVSDASRESFSTLVDRALASTQNLSDVHDESEDDDDWLNVDAESFDQLLSNATKGNRHSSAPDSMDIDPKEDLEDRVASQQAHKLKELAERVEQFVEAQGDLEGAKFEECVLSFASWMSFLTHTPVKLPMTKIS